MFLLPFKFDLELGRFPLLTVLICIVCLVVYARQHANEIEFLDRTDAFCRRVSSRTEEIMLEKLVSAAGVATCGDLVLEVGLTEDEDREATVARLIAASEPYAGFSRADSAVYMEQLFHSFYDRYTRSVPPLTTKALWYHPHSWDPWTMVTASFAHGSWDHVIGNLFFFFAFAAAVEVIIGSFLFLAVIAAMIFGTGISYSVAMMGVADALPTVGLSGIVMGMMAMLAYFVPTARIRCFYWFLIKIGTVAIPAWLLTLWYVGFDVFQLFTMDGQSGVNLVYHVSGAAMGLLIGILFFRKRRGELAHLTA